MKISNNQVSQYLNDNIDCSKHWIFNEIVSGKQLFCIPTIEKNRLKEVNDMVMHELSIFSPNNEYLFDSILSDWKNIEKETEVELIVGCPSMYDMMVRKNIIFIDLQNINNYLKAGWDVSDLLKKLITHEFVHICINHDYILDKNASFEEKTDYLVFQEGFAHYLASTIKYDEDFVLSHLLASVEPLKESLSEVDKAKQKELLVSMNTNEDYWKKFGAISGEMFLQIKGENLVEIRKLYNEGYKGFSNKIIKFSDALFSI